MAFLHSYKCPHCLSHSISHILFLFHCSSKFLFSRSASPYIFHERVTSPDPILISYLGTIRFSSFRCRYLQPLGYGQGQYLLQAITLLLNHHSTSVQSNLCQFQSPGAFQKYRLFFGFLNLVLVIASPFLSKK